MEGEGGTARRAREVELKDTVFVQKIPIDANSGDIEAVFSASGEIAKHDKTGLPRIKVFTDRTKEVPKGECMITFVDGETAAKAISTYNGFPAEGAPEAEDFEAVEAESGGDRRGRRGF